jgi:1,2-dihydroxy-3-keto-5-methylthiopentene dioxygenase
MSTLTIYSEQDAKNQKLKTQNGVEIVHELQKIGVYFERWAPRAPLLQDADDQAVLNAYTDDIERISKAEGYNSVDVIRVLPDNPNRHDIRARFLAEHTHDDDEARFFVEGSGVFYIHLNENVYMVLCEQGDYLRVPKNTPHWFDMGETPYITAIRWFTRPDGWVAQFTGQNYSDIFPKYESSKVAA